MVNTPTKLSVGVALDILRDSVHLMNRLNYEYMRERAIRDNYIRDAAISGVKQSVLVKITGLSRQQITNIVSKPALPVPPAWEDKGK